MVPPATPPIRPAVRGCFTCTHFGHRSDSYVWCVTPGHHHVHASPNTGCYRWMREPGADDVDGIEEVRAARWHSTHSILGLAESMGLDHHAHMKATQAAYAYVRRLQIDPEDCKEAADRLEAAMATDDWSSVSDLDPDRARVWVEVRDIIKTYAQAASRCS